MSNSKSTQLPSSLAIAASEQVSSTAKVPRISFNESVGRWILITDDKVPSKEDEKTTSTKVPVVSMTASTSAVNVNTVASRGSTLVENRPRLSSLLGSRLGRGLRFKSYPIRLIYRLSESSTAGGGINATFGVQPASSAEFSNLKALFDEVKVVGGKVLYNVALATGTPTTVQTFGVMTYDPIDATVYGSSTGAMVASQHQVFALNALTAGTNVSPSPVTSHGYWSFPFRTLRGTQRTVASSAAYGGSDWADTQDSADVWGYIKPWVDNVGSTGVITLVAYVHMDCIFRSRT